MKDVLSAVGGWSDGIRKIDSTSCRKLSGTVNVNPREGTKQIS